MSGLSSMTLRNGRVALLVLSALAASPGLAQRAPRSPEPAVSVPAASEYERSRIVMRAYAGCIAKMSRSSVEKYLAYVPGTTEGYRSARALDRPGCLVGELYMNEVLLRGGLFEALYEKDFGKDAPLALGDAPAVTYSNIGSGTTKVAQSYPSLAAFGDCVVRANPTGARELVLSKVASSHETKAFSSLMPHLEGCLPKGAELAFSRPTLRGYVAESLYRLSKAAAARPDRLAANE